MDGDSNDEGTVTESLNGETKPDPAKLAQTAIIKQGKMIYFAVDLDVMLSATSTQSPLATVSSVFTMPNISMPTVSLANSGGLGGLTDHLFMSHIPTDPPNAHSNSVTDSHTDKSGLGSLASPSQLFGQPQVAAPQFFLTGNGAQQFISIPVSLGTGGNHQIQLLTTSNGQIIATNLGGIPGLTQPLNLNLNSESLKKRKDTLSCFEFDLKWVEKDDVEQKVNELVELSYSQSTEDKEDQGDDPVLTPEAGSSSLQFSSLETCATNSVETGVDIKPKDDLEQKVNELVELSYSQSTEDKEDQGDDPVLTLEAVSSSIQFSSLKICATNSVETGVDIKPKDDVEQKVNELVELSYSQSTEENVGIECQELPDDYLQAILDELANSYARAYESLKSVCAELHLLAPHQITSVSMRKYTATLTQMLKLNKNEMDWVYHHLGHTKAVHKEHYRQMSSLLERTQVSKMFLVQDLNLTSKFKGKKLDEIDIKDIVFADNELDEEDLSEKLSFPENTVETEEEILVKEATDMEEVTESEDEEECEEQMMKIKPNKKPVTRQRWIDEEVCELRRYFRSNQAHSSTTPSSSTSSLGLTNLPQLLTAAAAGAQGQILAVGPQVLNQLSLSHNTTSSSSSHNSQSLTNGHLPQASAQQTAAQSAVQSAVQSAIRNAQSAKINNQSSVSTLSEGLPPSVSQLLPNTVGNSTESTTVDGINLDEIKEFAKQFKIRRLSLGLTQTQVGQALSATEGPAYSQSAICRFEKLDITPKSAQKIKPVLERWMQEAEERYKNGIQNLTDFIGSEPSKKRKRRTSFTPQALEVLNNFFERNTHPSGAEMTELSDKLNYDREVIRVWFCNKRQALKNTIKKLKQETP